MSILVLFSFISIVFLKAYAIGVIWRCYKFLTMRQHNLRSMIPYIIPDVSNFRQDRDCNSLLPNYEEAVLKQPPPCYHSVAVTNGCAATIVLPPETLMLTSTSTHFELTTMIPPPAYSTLQQNPNSIIRYIGSEDRGSDVLCTAIESTHQANTEIADIYQSESVQINNEIKNT